MVSLQKESETNKHQYAHGPLTMEEQCIHMQTGQVDWFSLCHIITDERLISQSQAVPMRHVEKLRVENRGNGKLEWGNLIPSCWFTWVRLFFSFFFFLTCMAIDLFSDGRLLWESHRQCGSSRLEWWYDQKKKKEKLLKDDRSLLIIHSTFRSTEVLLSMNNWGPEGFDDISFIESK